MKDSAYTETPNDTICRQLSGLKYREESQQTLDLDTLLIQLFIQDDWHNQWINKIALSFKQQLALIYQAYAFLLRCLYHIFIVFVSLIGISHAMKTNCPFSRNVAHLKPSVILLIKHAKNFYAIPYTFNWLIIWPLISPNSIALYDYLNLI